MTHPKRLHNIIFQLRFPGRSIFPELSRAYSLQHSDNVLETATDSKSVIDININNEYYFDTHTQSSNAGARLVQDMSKRTCWFESHDQITNLSEDTASSTYGTHTGTFTFHLLSGTGK